MVRFHSVAHLARCIHGRCGAQCTTSAEAGAILILGAVAGAECNTVIELTLAHHAA